MEMDDEIKGMAAMLKEQILSLDSLMSKDDALAAPPLSTETMESNSDIAALDRLIDNPDLGGAVFPVYGAVKAGKSTFLAYLLRHKVLPEQALPMTSIPIRIKHVPDNHGAPLHLRLPQSDKWNACVAGFKQKLIAGSLSSFLDLPANSTADTFSSFRDLLERIKVDTLKFPESADGGDVRTVLDDISHFVRVLWMTEIDFEKDYDIVIEPDLLPVIEMEMKAFQAFGSKSFSLLDTPGPNEAKALDALQKLGPKIMRASSGW